ncbi:MAG: hypothetical protein M1840_005098 [Geoglossum simile]|nr:MAG: hypothetical protein M1840_005098 [Geoglossum simile]
MSGSATALANYAYPTPISYGHRDLFVSCVAQDRSMKSKWRPSTSSGNEAWSPADGSFTAMGGVISLSEPYISVASRGQGLLDVYVAGSDSALYHKWYSSEWGPNSVMGYDRLGGGLSSSPTVVSWSKDREDIFVIGMPRGSGLYQMFWTPSGYSSWIAFGGTWATFAPTVVSWASGRLDVFLVGATDNALYHKYFDGTSWQPAIGFGSLGGYCTSRPVGVSWGTGRIDLFVRGGDSGLWHLSYDLKSGWTNWTSISGSVAIEAEPDAVSWGQKRIDVFAWGLADRAILHKSFDGENWTPEEGFESLGGDFSGPPKAASDAVGSVSVFAYGRRLNLLQKSWNQTTKQWNPKDTFLDLGTP